MINFVDRLDLPPYPAQTDFEFGEEISSFSLKNYSFYPIECFFDGEEEPHTLERGTFREFDFSVSKIKFRSFSDTRAHLEIFSVPESDTFSVDNTTISPFLLKIYAEGSLLNEIIFDVTEAFDPVFTLSIGTLVDNELIVRKDYVKTKIIATSQILARHSFPAETEIYLFYFGISTSGKMTISIN